MNNDQKNTLKFVLSIYALTHIFILFVPGYFWDDYTLFNLPAKSVLQQFYQNKAIWLGYYFNFIFKFSNPGLIFHSITLICNGFIVYGFTKILWDNSNIDKKAIAWLAVLLAVTPLNFSEVSAITSPRPIYLAIFICAVWLNLSTSNQLSWRKWITMPLFLISFLLNSLLVLYFVFLYLLWKNIKDSDDSLFLKILKNLHWVLLPFLFWMMKKLFLNPVENYENYNRLSLDKIFLIPLRELETFVSSFLGPLWSSIFLALKILPVLIFILIVIVYFQKRFQVEDIRFESQHHLFFGFGLILFFIGAFPYLAVGKLPASVDMAARHQLLLPFGFSFMFYYGFQWTTKYFRISESFSKYILTVIMATFILASWHNYLSFTRDSLKQESIQLAIKKEDIFKQKKSFIFNDKNASDNALNRRIRFYEYNAYFHKIFNSEEYMAIDIRDIGLLKEIFKMNLDYNFHCKDYQKENEFQLINIYPGRNHNLLYGPEIIELYLLRIFKPEKYKPIISQAFLLVPGTRLNPITAN